MSDDTTTPVTRTRAGLRTRAARHGWAVQVADGIDTFTRADRTVTTEWQTRGWFDAPAGRFYRALLLDEAGAILDNGNTADVRAWLQA